jgi:hypothetical protein
MARQDLAKDISGSNLKNLLWLETDIGRTLPPFGSSSFLYTSKPRRRFTKMDQQALKTDGLPGN